jgi:predicted HicB family RNase H-like nuclease
MKDMIKYKGYYGSVHYDSDAPIFYGKLEFIRALVSYEATDAIGIKNAFEEAVDDYLEMCEKERIVPEKPFKGSFNVRVGSKLHERIALAAQREQVSINNFICRILEEVCDINYCSTSA